MRTFKGFLLCSIAVVFWFAMSNAATALDESPVVINVEIKNSNDKAQLIVTMKIENGWHTYATVPVESASPATTIELDLPDSVTAIGDWKKPVGVPHDDGATVYENTVEFSRQLEIRPGLQELKIDVRVNYQACKAKLCQPPKEFETTIKVPAASIAPDSTSTVGKTNNNPPVFKNSFFSMPERLMVGAVPLNKAARQMYPSPAMYDVDNDGSVELVVGDIFGTLNVYENENEDQSSDPVWSKHAPLETAEGKKIKVSNW